MSANLVRDPTPLYPAFPDLPVLSSVTEQEKLIYKYQTGFQNRLRKSPYFLVDTTKVSKINQVPRYSDKYNVTSATKRSALDKDSLDPKFFPKAIWTAYFETPTDRPNKSRKPKTTVKKLNLDALETEEMEEGEEGDIQRQEGEQGEEPQEDYDLDDEEFGDDDYVNNYFDGGEGEGDDDYGGDEDGGGGD